MLKIIKATVVILITLSVVTLASCAVTGETSGNHWESTVSEIENVLAKAHAAYEQGDITTAEQLAKDAYFDVFESSGLETAIRLNIGSQRAFEVEYGFTEINQAIRGGADEAEVSAAISRLMTMIREDAGRLGGGDGGGSGGFLSSFLIILREGFEAILIIGAIIAYLVKSGNRDKVRVIYQASIVAIFASVATAFAIRFLFNLSGASQELLEGATMLLAVVVLFWVSFWLLSKIEAGKWQRYIQGRVARSLTAGSTLALGSAAFLAVYREGAETVLFYQALLGGSAGQDATGIWLGLAVGLAALVAIFIAVRWGSIKVPIKPFFMVTGAFLYYMAFTFAGEGIRELQEAGTLGTSIIPGFPTVTAFGIYPTWESIALQGALMVIVAVALVYQFLVRPRRMREEPAAQS